MKTMGLGLLLMLVSLTVCQAQVSPADKRLADRALRPIQQHTPRAKDASQDRAVQPIRPYQPVNKVVPPRQFVPETTASDPSHQAQVEAEQMQLQVEQLCAQTAALNLLVVRLDEISGWDAATEDIGIALSVRAVRSALGLSEQAAEFLDNYLQMERLLRQSVLLHREADLPE